ncbi:MAG: hypothetical protein O2887_02265 [Bacteroidetes bacterium]|nr:hypothetical protein [Bacteroidota bacterium]MDA1119314.1 hypothetical protein [Bacteroidota bacterium]
MKNKKKANLVILDKNPLEDIRNVLDKEGLAAFREVSVVPDYETGVLSIAQSKGIAGLKANTVMFGWSEKPNRLESQLRMMQALTKVKKNTVLVRINWAHEPGQEKCIDLWWRGKQQNGDLMLLLAYLLNLNHEWCDAKIVIRSVVSS